jgi:hypothetical protein
MGLIKKGEEEAIKASIMNDSCLFMSQDDPTFLKKASLKEMMGTEPTVVDNFSKLLEQTVQAGNGVAKLIWKYDLHIFQTLCIVSDEGVVYDNVITYTFPPERTIIERQGPVEDKLR